MELIPWLQQTALVVCVGSGGVGKTTTSASIASFAAVQGRRVLVVTIDPAKRLANSLGLEGLGPEEHRIDLSSIPDAKGELWALMLDSRHTFDGLIAKISPTPEIRDRILANHIYRHMADTFAGSQDYMAVEKLYDMVQTGKYDLIVLDTPPVKNALDFLESPGRVIRFMDEKVLSWFLAPTEGLNLASRLLGSASTAVLWIIGQVFGKEFLEDVTGFFKDMQGLYDGFRKRNDAVLALFRSPTTSFVTVCGPTEPSIDVAEFFQEELRERRLPRAGVVMNQVHQVSENRHDASLELGGLAKEVGEDLPTITVASVVARLSMAHRRLQEKVLSEKLLEERVRKSAIGGGFLQKIPRFEGEVHDLASLVRVGEALFLKPASKL